jgi:hypothetical protein
MGIVTSQTERVYGFLEGEIRDCERMVGKPYLRITSELRVSTNVTREQLAGWDI